MCICADGGNDELMIRRASIGCGIMGLEGSSAARAADYSFSQFRFLHTLLFVHGHWCNYRISRLILFIFWKAQIIAICMYIFCLWSAYSGTQFFNDAIYILFNITFTAIPILMLAIFDRGGLSKSTLENEPRAYLSIAHGAYFNTRKFVLAILTAVWNTSVIFGIVISTFADDTSGSEGRNHGLWCTSTIVYTCLVMLASLRILDDCQSLNIIVAFFVIASMLLYFPIVLLLANLLRLNPNLYGSFGPIFGDPLTWFVMIFAVGLPIMVDVFYKAVVRAFSPSYVHVLQERQTLSPADLLRVDKAMMGVSSNRLRARAVPVESQSAKQERLIGILKRSLEQAAEADAAAAGGSSAAGSPSPAETQRRAQALALTMARLQNLSGSNFDATPQRGIMSLYERDRPLTVNEVEDVRRLEASMLDAAVRQHQIDQLRRQHIAATQAARDARLQRESISAAHDAAIPAGIAGLTSVKSDSGRDDSAHAALVLQYGSSDHDSGLHSDSDDPVVDEFLTVQLSPDSPPRRPTSGRAAAASSSSSAARSPNDDDASVSHFVLQRDS